MASICFYFQIHQPLRLRDYQIFQIGRDHQYFSFDDSDSSNKKIIEKVSQNCYLPATNLIIELLATYPEFQCSFSISGLALEQFEKYIPDLLDNFRRMAQSNRVEFLAETYYHSLSWIYSKSDFESQVQLHHDKIKSLLNYEPTAFRNTELIYDNKLAKKIEQLGYKTILAEGVDHVLGWRSANYVYSPAGAEKLKLFLRNYQLSDDIAFRFSDQSWSSWPLTAEKYADWLAQINGNGYVINLFMDFETFGEHHSPDTGIFEFMKFLPKEILKKNDMDFLTISEASTKYPVSDYIDVTNPISWADEKRDLSAWSENALQRSAIKAIFELERQVVESKDPQLIDDWRKLQTSDHFYYMSTNNLNSGEVHAHFSPYDSPYSAFTNYMNVLQDINYRLNNNLSSQ